MNLAPYDELNIIRERLIGIENTKILDKKEKVREIEDMLWDVLTLAYMYGVSDVNEMLGTDYTVDGMRMVDVIDKKIAGETFIDRIEKYVTEDSIDVNGILRLAETEMTRDYNESALETAMMDDTPDNPVYKEWSTMMDERVRDTHDGLEGVRIPVKDKFYSYDGDSAYAPGGFSLPENNINCRCGLRFGH